MVIVSNFCKLFSGHIMFPIVGLKMLSDILKVETVDETQQAKLSILIHLTKTPYNPAKFTNFLYEVLNLNISPVGGDTEKWLSLARNVVAHSQVRLI